jgi:hypothetical protein
MMTSVPAEPLDRQGFTEWLAKRGALTGRDLEKWDDFCKDRVPSAPSLLAWPYHTFKKILGAGLKEDPALAARLPAFSIDVLCMEANHFGRLAEHYGDLYRGTVIANYLLGFFAVFCALAPAIIGIEIDSMWIWIFPLIELGLLSLMLGLFLHGRSPHLESAGTASAGRSWWFNQRWHERWLEYRSLAEWFRYADLRRSSPDVSATAGDDWASRYFAWRLGSIEWPEGNAPDADDAKNLLALIHGQQGYHHDNATRCERISHRLHVIIACVFVASLGGALFELLDLALQSSSFLDLALEPLGFPAGWRLTICDIPVVSWLAHSCHSHGAHPWIFFTAAMPALAGALYGIHSSCEFAKLAHNSYGMVRSLNLLRTEAEELFDPKRPVDPEKLVDPDPKAAPDKQDKQDINKDSLKKLIGRFLLLCSDEATGWHEILWDKNVPLG